MQHVSIKFRLSLAFFFFLFLVVFLGAFSIASLNDFNGVADQLRNRWLPNTRFLGDINNYTSDFRAAEGTLLLTSNQWEIAASKQEMDELDRNITKAQHGYEKIYHDDKEAEIYKHFSEDWDNYRKIVNHVLALVDRGSKDNAVTIYKTTSRTAYDAASDTLGLLTDLNVEKDQEASDRAAETYQRVQFLTIIAMLLGVFLVAAGVVYIRRSISAPMLDLAENMHRLASNDTNNTEVNISISKRRDEVGEMARALVVFRNNVIELAHNRQALIQQASMLEEKLEHERNLMAAQGNFISMASHEFRTPLNIIDGHAQRLMKMKSPVQTEEIAERVGKVRSAVKQITVLIDNLINSARLFEDTPELYFHPTEIDLAVLLHEVCLEHREIVSGIQIMERIEKQPLKTLGDPTLLRQMFSNLLYNAVKYSPIGSRIEVNAINDSDHIIVAVQDYGIGVPQKDIDRLFERYFRGSNVSNISGTGIGLYLAKMIVELHGGSITINSVEGKGSIFTVHLQTQISKGS